MVEKTEQLVYHAKDLDQAEKVRRLLLNYKPRPWVYVMFTNGKDATAGFDLCISTEWGTFPSGEYVEHIKSYIKKCNFS